MLPEHAGPKRVQELRRVAQANERGDVLPRNFDDAVPRCGEGVAAAVQAHAEEAAGNEDQSAERNWSGAIENVGEL